MQLGQICRLCLEEKTNNETVLVEIFSSIVNEPGEIKLSEKINQLSGILISKNDGMPSLVCHKCIVSVENFVEFRTKVLKSDEKLREVLNLNGTQENHIQNAEQTEEDDENEIVKLDPNKIYESSEEEANIETKKDFQKQAEVEKHNTGLNIQASNEINLDKKKKQEIFHCKYCDQVFSDFVTCTNHENFNHDQENPYECNVCSFKTTQHQYLIIHIKNEHQTDKPFVCSQCSKRFLRRSDLRKHVFVHAGIRMYSCNLCTKSFTRSTNLTKHKRTHHFPKNFKCNLCPKAYENNAELSRHMEIHMNRNTFNCKFCNQVFIQRDELEIHQKSHIVSSQMKQQIPPMQPQQTSIVFYNQNPMDQQQQHQQQQQPFLSQNHTPMNFYTESVNPIQQKNEYPIMNQLLGNFPSSPMIKCEKCIEQFPSIQLLQNHHALYHSKNFSCGICNSSYYKKKELDRHILSAHTDIKYNCTKCGKSFSRKDKLARHEKTHMIPAFYNCPSCTAVFVRKNLLELHAKIHELPNSHPKFPESAVLVMDMDPSPPQQQQATPQPQTMNENFLQAYVSPINNKTPPLDLSAMKFSNQPEQPAVLYPMNLSTTQSQSNEPMDLSNEKHYEDSVSITKIEPILEPPKIILDSDDEDLKIVENNNHEQNDHHMISKTDNSTMEAPTALFSMTGLKEEEKIDEIAFRMTSRLSDLDKLEPSQDLPMEIFQIPDV